MFTIKYIDRDGVGRFSMGRDIRIVGSGNRVQTFGWVDCDSGEPNAIDFASTAYVMNDAGATVGKYVVLGRPDTNTAA